MLHLEKFYSITIECLVRFIIWYLKKNLPKFGIICKWFQSILRRQYILLDVNKINDKIKYKKQYIISTISFLEIFRHKNIRNELSRRHYLMRDFLDKDFLNQMMFHDFDARYWELLLGSKLFEWGYKLEKTDSPQGSDFCFKFNHKTIVIQAYVPENGKIPPMVIGGSIAQKVPEFEIAKHLRGRIVAKINDNIKTLEGVENPNNNESCLYILSINSSRLEFSSMGGNNKCTPPPIS